MNKIEKELFEKAKNEHYERIGYLNERLYNGTITPETYTDLCHSNDLRYMYKLEDILNHCFK